MLHKMIKLTSLLKEAMGPGEEMALKRKDWDMIKTFQEGNRFKLRDHQTIYAVIENNLQKNKFGFYYGYIIVKNERDGSTNSWNAEKLDRIWMKIELV